MRNLKRWAGLAWAYLNVVNDGFELRRALHPGVHQLHGRVKVLHIFAVHLQEGSQFLENVPDSRVHIPKSKGRESWVKSGSRGEPAVCKHSPAVSNLTHVWLQGNALRFLLTLEWGGCVWEHQCVHLGREKEMTEGLEEMFFLTQHCGRIQRSVWSLPFSPTLGLSRSYTTFVLSHSCLLWLCLTSDPHSVLSPSLLFLSPPLCHLSPTPTSLPRFHLRPYSLFPPISQAAFRLKLLELQRI